MTLNQAHRTAIEFKRAMKRKYGSKSQWPLSVMATYRWLCQQCAELREAA